MSTPSQPPEPTLAKRQYMTSSYAAFKHNASLSMLILAPILIALPPRKLDLYTFSLAGAIVLSANQLARERTGTGVWEGIKNKVVVREEMGAEAQRNGWIPVDRKLEGYEPPQGRLLEESRSIAGGKDNISPIATASKEDWKAERLRTEQEKLDEGEGYGSMIVDQIWDVWNWGEKKMEKVEEEDRKVLRERERVEREKRRGG